MPEKISFSIYNDEYFMRQALKEAEKAYELDEIPIGVVVVCNNQIIARAHNQTEQLNDVTAHAEIMAITAASDYLGSKFLDECEIFSTLEPCNMCAGALYWARPKRIIYGAGDDKRGFMLIGKSMLHPKTKLEYGIRNEECSTLVKKFFNKKRKPKPGE